VDAYYYNYRTDHWFIAGTAGFLTSLQQDLSARTTLGGGVGMDVIRGSRESLQLIGGALFYNETYSPASGARSGKGSDAQFLMQYTKYAFTRLQFTVQAGAFPSLTAPLGRVRLGIQSSVKRDLGKNLTLLFSLYENYDSRPPVQAGKNDFGTSTSIGWTF
jgi:putative salt-induced outer membrane protein YdiY